MRCTAALIVLATMADLLSSSAIAALTPYWVSVPMSPAAIADDPALADQQTWSLRVTLDEGFWHVGGMRVTLPAGEVFYNHSLGGQTRPPDALVALFPSVAHDTYVTSPRQQTAGVEPAVRSGHPNKFEPPSFGGPADPMPLRELDHVRPARRPRAGRLRDRPADFPERRCRDGAHHRPKPQLH